MPLLTTTIGAYPKPDYVEIPDWFREGGPGAGDPTTKYTEFMREADEDLEEKLVRGAEQVVRDQVEAGIDVPTDGEIRRDDYIHYHCRHLDGIDFESLTEKAMRTGAWTARVPTITGPIRAREPFLPREWRIVQAMTDKPVKVTVPGPMTVTDSIADDYYGSTRARSASTSPRRSTPRSARLPRRAAAGSRSTSRCSRAGPTRRWPTAWTTSSAASMACPTR